MTIIFLSETKECFLQDTDETFLSDLMKKNIVAHVAKNPVFKKD